MAKFSTTIIKGLVILLAVAIVLLLKAHYYSDIRNIASVPSKRTVEITYSFTVSDIPPQAQHMRIWVPVPLNNDHQKLQSWHVLGDWSYRMVKEPEFNNRFLVFDLSDTSLPGSGEAVFSIKFLVSRRAVRTLHRYSSSHPFAQDKLARYLVPNRLIPIDGKIAAEARQVAGYLPNPLKQARLLYDHIVATVTYDKSGTGWGRGDAVYACDVRTGNCTDFHSLFIGQARALGIPARFIMGLPLPENKTEGFIPGYHCWGEFYLPEKGWCPIDASEASKFPEKKEQFFGGLDEHRVAFTLGRDIKLPGSTAEPLNYAIYPHVEIDGRPHENIQTSFFFKGYTTTGKQTESSSMKTLLTQQI